MGFIWQGFGSEQAARVAAVRRDQVNPPQSFLVLPVGSGRVPDTDSNWER